MLVENAGERGQELKNDKGCEIRGASYTYTLMYEYGNVLSSVHIRRSFTFLPPSPATKSYLSLGHHLNCEFFSDMFLLSHDLKVHPDHVDIESSVDPADQLSYEVHLLPNVMGAQS